MAITPRPAEPTIGNPPAWQAPHVGSPLLPGLVGAPRATITFIAAAPHLFGEYLSYLRDHDYLVSLVRTVKEASIQAEDHCPDLVFLDLGESSQAGLMMLRELKADDCLGSIPLVMLASFNCLDDIHAGLKLGACDYIIETETMAWDLARRVPVWAQIDSQLHSDLQESTVKPHEADREITSSGGSQLRVVRT